jgi:hypothetical protein
MVQTTHLKRIRLAEPSMGTNVAEVGHVMSFARFSMRRKRTDAGFSVIELLIVIGMIMVMAAVAIPSIAGFIRVYYIRGAAQEVRATIQAARLKAVANNVRWGTLFVVVDNKRYQWAIEDRLVGEGDGKEKGRRIDAADLVKADWPGQVGPMQILPGTVEFDTTCPDFSGATVTWTPGMRFSNLGMMCDPGTTTCPSLGAVGANFVGLEKDVVEEVEGDDVVTGGGATICLHETVRNQYRRVHISHSGRIDIMEQ